MKLLQEHSPSLQWFAAQGILENEFASLSLITLNGKIMDRKPSWFLNSCKLSVSTIPSDKKLHKLYVV